MEKFRRELEEYSQNRDLYSHCSFFEGIEFLYENSLWLMERIEDFEEQKQECKSKEELEPLEDYISTMKRDLKLLENDFMDAIERVKRPLV